MPKNSHRKLFYLILAAFHFGLTLNIEIVFSLSRSSITQIRDYKIFFFSFPYLVHIKQRGSLANRCLIEIVNSNDSSLKENNNRGRCTLTRQTVVPRQHTFDICCTGLDAWQKTTFLEQALKNMQGKETSHETIKVISFVAE